MPRHHFIDLMVYMLLHDKYIVTLFKILLNDVASYAPLDSIKQNLNHKIVSLCLT